MKSPWLSVIALCALMFGCGASQQPDPAQVQPQMDLPGQAAGGDINVFNPWLNENLPNTRLPSGDGAKMLSALGARGQSIEGEAKHRKYWREEIYPVVFGERKAPHEIIVVLDFSSPASAGVWKAVTQAAGSLAPAQCKIAVFGRSQENYGTDLMGMTIWLAHSRPGQAMPWLTYALDRWNAVKAAQKRAGAVRRFTGEYDATASAQDYPILAGYMAKVQPPVPAKQELAVARYCYNAGNVNMYQANQICQYYGITSLPAVIADGKLIAKPAARAILAALK